MPVMGAALLSLSVSTQIDSCKQSHRVTAHTKGNTKIDPRPVNRGPITKGNQTNVAR